MNSPDKKKASLKEKISHEIIEYGINVAYLTLVFAAFTWYRRLILADVGITYTNYGVAVIEALILGKVIMIGDLLRFGRRLENKPLILPTLLKTVVFIVFIGLFTLIEHAVKGLLKGEGLMGGIMEFFGKGPYEILAGGLVIFVAFIPFFAFRELSRVLGGEGKILALFFKSRDDQRIE